MNAEKFVMEVRRMCRTYGTFCACETGRCPLFRGRCNIKYIDSKTEARDVVEAVEKWAEEHPAKTNGEVILEMIPPGLRTRFPGVIEGDAGLIIRKDWWDAEYTGGEGE